MRVKAVRVSLMDMATLTSTALLHCHDQHTLIDRAGYRALSDLPTAERMAAEIVAARQARGERPVGWKIGFTNRSIWPLYGVGHPIWGVIYDSTLTLLDTDTVRLESAHFVQGRLEPEIVVKLAYCPVDPSPLALLQACEWIAHGFEIVQSPYPDWKFSAAEGIAAQGLHGALLVGRRFSPTELGGRPEQVLQRLCEFELVLEKNGTAHAKGAGAVVLDGPLHALTHLAREFAQRGRALRPADIITTGTLTDAQPLVAGDRWQTRLTGIALSGLTLDLV